MKPRIILSILLLLAAVTGQAQLTRYERWTEIDGRIDLRLVNGTRHSKESVLAAYDFTGPGAMGPFYTVSNGSGAGAVTHAPTVDASPFGFSVATTGVTASGSTWIGTGSSFYTPSLNFESRMAVEAVFTTPVFSTAGTEEFADIIGFCSSLTSTINVIGFRVDVANSTARVINNGSTSGTALNGLTLTANTRYRARVEYFYTGQGGAYTARFYMKAEPKYVSPRDWPWTPSDVIGTITDGQNGVTFPTGLTYGGGMLMRKLAGSSPRTSLISQLIISTNFPVVP